MDTLFSHVCAVTMDPGMRILPDAFVGVEGRKISYLSTKPPEEQPKTIFDGTGMVLMPGLVNCRTQLEQTLLRTWSHDCGHQQRLEENLYPQLEALDRETAKASALLGIAECLRMGVTSVSDQSGHLAAVAEAAAESGIRANLAPEMAMYLGEDFDFETYPPCQELRDTVEQWHGFDQGRLQVEAGLHGVYSSSQELWDALTEYSVNSGLGVQVNLSRFPWEQEDSLERLGLSPAQALHCSGLYAARTNAHFCTSLEEEDRQLLGRQKVSAVVCPQADRMLGLPEADVPALVRAGMNVALGTDSAAICPSLDLLAQAREIALAAKAKSGDPEAMAAPAALLMATVCGAKAQGREKSCGMLQVGMEADLILLDFTQPQLIPCRDVPFALVHGASGRDVCLTMVAGKILYAKGEFPTIDLRAVMEKLAAFEGQRQAKAGT